MGLEIKITNKTQIEELSPAPGKEETEASDQSRQFTKQPPGTLKLPKQNRKQTSVSDFACQSSKQKSSIEPATANCKKNEDENPRLNKSPHPVKLVILDGSYYNPYVSLNLPQSIFKRILS